MLCESSAEDKDFDDDTKKTSYNFSCAECAKSFQSARGLKTHYGKIHKKKNLLLSSSVIPEINGSIENDLDSSTSLVNRITLAKHSFRIINRIPKSARYVSAAALSEAIDSCIESNSYNSWENLLLFAYNVLAIPSTKNSIKLSLTKIIKQNIKNNFNSSENIRKEDPKKSYKNYHNTDISKIILNKVSNGDLTSAVRILSSSDTLAPYDHSTLSVLQTKHPRSSFASWECPIMTPSSPPLQIFKKDVLLAVRSFRTGSASGLDSIRPSHIQDLLSFSAGSAGQKLLNSLTQLCNLMLLGNVPPQICPIIYGASLCALRKRDGGIRPIAIGCFYRRLVAKLCCSMEREQLGTYFRPLQFGFGTHGGCEAVAHSARMFINQHPNPECKVFLKLDFKNAFNMIERKIMLQNVIHFIPKLFPFLNQCYREPSILNFGKYCISSERGIQQGDPLGPALFCLSIHDLVRTISCEFNCWYLDDGSIAGDVYSVLENFKRIIEKSKEIGLTLNYGKCELIYLSDMDEDSMNKFRNLAPDIKIIDKTECSLLGIPLTIEKLPEYLEEKTNSLNLMSNRLQKLPAHVAFYLLKNCLLLPKLMYTLRCCPTWRIPRDLKKFDDLQRYITENIINIDFNEISWLQATLPVRLGGLGLRSASSLALPAFLSSFSSVTHLIKSILPQAFCNIPNILFNEAETLWYSQSGCQLQVKEKSSQKCWDHPLLHIASQKIAHSAKSFVEKARINAVSVKESGAWLNALPVASLGTLLDDESFRIAVALRLGSPICASHKCKCGSFVEANGIHGLSCKNSAGRFSRHHQVNDLLKRALISAGIPTILEPSGISRDDGKRPDGMTLIPWKCGKLALWDFTCTDTLAPSHLHSTANSSGAAAIASENLKRRKYKTLMDHYFFFPVAVETFGVFAPQSLAFIQEIGKRLMKETQEPRATTFLIQRISIAIQRGNATSILGTIPTSNSFDELLLYPHRCQRKFFHNTARFQQSSIDRDFQQMDDNESDTTFKNNERRSIDKEENYRNGKFSDDINVGESDIITFDTIIPSHNQVKTLGLNGLQNIGNTCFMNSIIQCLSNTHWLLDYLREDFYLKDINSTSNMKGALIKAFVEVIKQLWSEDSPDGVVNTVSLKSQIQKFAPRFMGYAQQDAQEFLRYLLTGLHEEINSFIENSNLIVTESDELSNHENAQEAWLHYLKMNNSKIVEHFVGQLKSTLKCTYCGHCSVTFDPFWDLSLSIPQRTGQVRLSHCLNLFTRDEILDGDEKPTCSKCKGRRKCTKSFLIQKFPKILVIHLKRFSAREGLGIKLNSTVDFPIEGLDMTNYAAENITPCRYNLYAISNHSGTTYTSGHYTAFCKHPYTGSWHQYNDAKVSSISPKSLVSGEAYVLLYEQEDIFELC